VLERYQFRAVLNQSSWCLCGTAANQRTLQSTPGSERKLPPSSRWASHFPFTRKAIPGHSLAFPLPATQLVPPHASYPARAPRNRQSRNASTRSPRRLSVLVDIGQSNRRLTTEHLLVSPPSPEESTLCKLDRGRAQACLQLQRTPVLGQRAKESPQSQP